MEEEWTLDDGQEVGDMLAVKGEFRPTDDQIRREVQMEMKRMFEAGEPENEGLATARVIGR